MATKTTANEPAGEIDPGGARPAKPERERKPELPGSEKKPEPAQKVETGDRNRMKRP